LKSSSAFFHFTSAATKSSAASRVALPISSPSVLFNDLKNSSTICARCPSLSSAWPFSSTLNFDVSRMIPNCSSDRTEPLLMTLLNADHTASLLLPRSSRTNIALST
jgi:hypothetical protein